MQQQQPQLHQAGSRTSVGGATLGSALANVNADPDSPRLESRRPAIIIYVRTFFKCFSHYFNEITYILHYFECWMG